MADADPRDQIALLETQIEELSEVMERSRKVILISKVAMAAGGVWLVGFMFGVVGDPGAMMGGIAAMIGGVVVFGSSTTTLRQTEVTLKEAEGLRAALIGTIELRVVPGPTSLN